MDYPPNFSLGITQLDAKEKEKDIPVGSVPSKFDEEDPNFAENCSKHRNDPVTMKKLKEVATSRLKKSSSKAATKKKFDDSGRPRLPKVLRSNTPMVSLSASFKLLEDMLRARVIDFILFQFLDS
ncbi:uncharacterized protein LOC107876761 [Capsicum annuum]|uniref:uncharacterized protein LOC107876761 n=1 Tax=Capsicum annuum TaxID=4072 RepID=UPI001FB05E02|nr:uncharacterized protein LOC107876761 [Capsicum annuum]